jgi:hypothetical protein
MNNLSFGSRKDLLAFLLKYKTILVISLIGLVFVANTWTPSSYGLAYRFLGEGKLRPDFGRSRGIVSDEWMVLTPYHQIAVNNDFERFNKNSPYKEDLRNHFNLPLKDWALVFKPLLWGYHLLPPAYAYSLYWFLSFLSFIIGYCLLFQSIGINKQWALIGALLIFFSRFCQVWLTTHMLWIATSPWPLLVYIQPWSWRVKFPVLVYTCAVWLFSGLYVPGIIALAFALGILLVAFRPDALRAGSIVQGVSASLIAVGLIYVYFQDYLAVMQNTVYPGLRSSNGGTTPVALYLSQFLPYLAADKFKPLIPNSNTCEVGVVSSWFPLLALVFSDHESILKHIRDHKVGLLILIVGLSLTMAWMLLPIPGNYMKLLLWHRVPSNRMIFASGLLWTTLFLMIFNKNRFILSWKRFVIFSAFVIAAWVYSKYGKASLNPLETWFDLFVLIPLAGILLIRFKIPFFSTVAIGIVALLTNIYTFGSFNPLQSAKPIFQAKKLPVVATLNDLSRSHPSGWLALKGHYGACLVGLGLPAVNHVLVRPQLEFFRSFFPEMPEKEFNHVFNRFQHVILKDAVDTPHVLQGDAIIVPFRTFAPKLVVEKKHFDSSHMVAGYIDTFTQRHQLDGKCEIIVKGWGKFEEPSSKDTLLVETNLDVDQMEAVRLVRGDVSAAFQNPRLFISGFELRAMLKHSCQLENPIFPQLKIQTRSNKNELMNLPTVFTCSNSSNYPNTLLPMVGSIDAIKLSDDGKKLSISGWGLFSDSQSDVMGLIFYSNTDIAEITVRRSRRDDVAKIIGQEYANAGFHLSVVFRKPIDLQTLKFRLSGFDSNNDNFLIKQDKHIYKG